MTTLKLMAAALGISLAAITALPGGASAERVDREPRYYHANPYYDRDDDRRRHWRGDCNHRFAVYAVPYPEFQRYVNRHGHRDLNSPRFRKWAVRHGRPVRHPGSYFGNNRPQNYWGNNVPQTYWGSHWNNGWWNQRFDRGRNYWQPQWVYVDLRSGRYWF